MNIFTLFCLESIPICAFPITWYPNLGKRIHPLSRVLVTTGNYKNLPESTAKKYPLSWENGNTHEAPSCIRVRGLAVCSSLWLRTTVPVCPPNPGPWKWEAASRATRSHPMPAFVVWLCKQCQHGADPRFHWGGGGGDDAKEYVRPCTSRVQTTKSLEAQLWILMLSRAIWALFLSILIQKRD